MVRELEVGHMPAFLKRGTYQPKNYTLADYAQYLYLKNHVHGNESHSPTLNAPGSGSIKVGTVISKLTLFLFHISELECLQLNFEVEADMAKYINDCMEQQHESKREDLLRTLEDASFDSKFGPEFKAKRLAFWEAMTLVSQVESGSCHRDPDELSPKQKSLSNLMFAALPWRSAPGHVAEPMPHAISTAHAANISVANDPKLEEYCEHDLFRVREDRFALVPPPITENAGFFLKIYHSPAFQHWLTQLLLLAVVLTAALVIAAFTVNATLLPLAVAGAVKGFSALAAKMFLGAAIVVGATAALAFSASLHARFFAARGGEEGAVPPAGASLNPANR